MKRKEKKRRIRMKENVNESIIVGFDSTNGDNSVLIVGRKNINKNRIDIINAFEGKEAEDLYLKLTTPVKKA